MKYLNYLSLVFLILFGVSVQAQEMSLNSVKEKLSELPQKDALQLNNLIYGVPSIAFMSEENHPEIYRHRDQHEILKLKVKNEEELKAIISSYSKEIKTIEIIEITWNGSPSNIELSRYLALIPNLQYIYIRSFQTLNKEVIHRNLSNLISSIKDRKNVSVIYETMGQPE